MPYMNGKRVSLETWRAAHPPKNPFIEGVEDPDDAQPTAVDPEKPPRRTPTKARQAKDAIAKATGIDVTSLDETDLPDVPSLPAEDDAE